MAEEQKNLSVEDRISKLENNHDRLMKVEQTNERILTLVTELKIGVCGSEQVGVDGIIQKVRKHEAYIESDKRDKYRFAGAISAITFVITIGVSLLAVYLSK